MNAVNVAPDIASAPAAAQVDPVADLGERSENRIPSRHNHLVSSELGPVFRGGVRASDEDRERTTRSLRVHFAAGRLAADEFERRVADAYGAQTRRELARLLSDLPGDRLGRAARRFYYTQRTGLRYHAATYVTVNGTLIGVWELTGQGLFWPGLVLAPMTAALGLHAAVSRWLRRRLRIIRGRGNAE